MILYKKVLLAVILSMQAFYSFSYDISTSSFHTSQGLPTEYLFDIQQGSDEKIWISGMNGIFYYNGNEFRYPPFNYSLPNNQIESFVIWNEFIIGGLRSYGLFIANTRSNNVRLIPFENSSISHMALCKTGILFASSQSKINLLEWRNKQLVIQTIYHTGMNRIKWVTTACDKIYFLKDQGVFCLEKSGPRLIVEGKYETLSSVHHALFVSAQNHVYRIGKNGMELFASLPGEDDAYIRGIHPVSDSAMYVYDETRHQLYWIRKSEGQTQIMPVITCKNGYYSQGITDNYGNFWLSTYGNGLHHIVPPASSVRGYELPAVINKIRTTEGGKVYTATMSGIYTLSNDSVTTVIDRYHFKDVAIRSGDTIIGTYAFMLNDSQQVSSYTKVSPSGTLLIIDASEYFITDTDGSLYVTGYSNYVYKYRHGKIKPLLFNLPIKKFERIRFYKHYGPDAEVVISQYHFCVKYRQRKYMHLLANQVNEVIETSPGKLYIIFPHEIIFVDLHKRRTHTYTSENYTFYDLQKRDTMMYLATSAGLISLSQRGQVNILNQLTGIPFNEVHHIDTNWFSSSNMLYPFGSQQVSEPGNINLYLESVTSRQNNYPLSDSIIIPRNISDIAINYYCGYFSRGNTRYMYTVNGNDWVSTRENIIHIYDLNYGKNTIRIQAIVNQVYPSNTLNLVIYRTYPFYLTLVFRLSMSILLLSIVYYGFLLRVRYVKRTAGHKHETELKINNLKIKSASLALNPHFIFNIINSLQYLINYEKNKEAIDYLGKFSYLMRFVVDNYTNDYITLEKEIRQLKHYMELENLRFDNRIHFHIHLDQSIIPDQCFIPIFLLQPLVENSIIHGLAPKARSKEKWMINISFRKTESGFLEIKVSDNGIGLSKSSAQNKNKFKKSVALENIRQRLNLINNLPAEKCIWFAPGEIGDSGVTVYLLVRNILSP